jgi:hypothetical protein
MQEVLLFSELSSREQLSHIEMDSPAEIADSSFFHDGIQFSVSARDFSPTHMDEVELPTSSSSSSSASASATMRPPSSFSGPPIDEWRYTIILLLAPAIPPARAATSSAPNAVPPRVAPVNHAPAVDAAQVAAPPLIFIPGLAPGPLPEPLFPLADPEPVFGPSLSAPTSRQNTYRWSYHRLCWPLASCPASRFKTYLSALQCSSSVLLQGLFRRQRFRRR